MNPWILIDSAQIAGGDKKLGLYRRDSDFSMKVGNLELMNSRMHGSEESLAQLACAKIKKFEDPKILIGGLGMGFTLRAALDVLPQKSQVVVAELLPEVVKWNQGVLAGLARNPLKDKRVRVDIADVGIKIREGRGVYSAILLDVDNGPESLFRKDNDRLYNKEGIMAAHAALKSRGVLAVWSAAPDKSFVKALNAAGFSVEELSVSARSGAKSGGRHFIWLATAR